MITLQSVVDKVLADVPEVVVYDRSEHNVLRDNRDLSYIVFGGLVIPFMEQVAVRDDKVLIQRMCDCLEDLAVQGDAGVRNLLAVEIGEWLAFTRHEAVIGCAIGKMTARVINYVPGLATQRFQDGE